MTKQPKTLLHIEDIASVSNVRGRDLIIGSESSPVREECSGHGRSAPDLDPHPRICIVGIAAPMVFKRHTQSGQIEQWHQHILASGGRYTCMSWQIGGDGGLFGSLEDAMVQVP